jgi:hypothetical protein
MKDLISIILQNEGVPGVEKFIKDEVKANDRKWFILYCLSAVIVAGGVCFHECKNIPDNYQKVSVFCDSLQGYVDTSMYVEGFKGR